MEPERPAEEGGAAVSPLLSGEPEVWDRLLESVGPASILLVIRQHMGATLRRGLTAEDLWQETLLHAWSDRARFEWRGLASFRRWLIQIALHRIHDASDRAQAAKRGGGLEARALEGGDGHDGRSFLEGLARLGSTTPSRLASLREEAGRLHAALASVPEELREVVRLRLFEELTMEEVAERTGLGLSGARHRFRKGAALYEQALRKILPTGSGSR